jgi:hypothetical protein
MHDFSKVRRKGQSQSPNQIKPLRLKGEDKKVKKPKNKT